MAKFTVQVHLHTTEKYNGVFKFDNLEDAIRKVKGNIIANINEEDIKCGLDIYGAAHYFDQDDNGYCVIHKVSD